MPEPTEYSVEDFEGLDTERGTGAEVDWDGFMTEVAGQIGNIDSFKPAYEAAGGNSVANLRGKLDRLVKDGLAVKRYDGRAAVYKIL